MKQQSQPSLGPRSKHKIFDLLTIKFLIKYQPIIYSHQSQLNATIYVTPKKDLVNTPLEIELRGYSHIQALSHPKEKSSQRSIEVTEDFLNETDQKLEINVLMGQSKKFESIQSDMNPKARALEQMNQEQKKQGEYFLQGCNVLYQIKEETGQRLQALFKDGEYQYPVNFSLPARLPSSVDHIVVKDIHITIKYTLEVKLILIDKQFGKKEYHTLIIPFEIHEPQKNYPNEQLVVRDLIRCYHATGKRLDEVMSRPFVKLLNCLCPKLIYDKYLEHQHHFKSTFKSYDLYHVELVAVVNKEHNIFLVVRAYQEPQADSLTLNRQKSEKIDKSIIKQVNSLGEVPNDISLVSMKQTQRKHIGLGLFKVQVQMIAELVNICSQSIFKKVVTLNQSNYDMVEGEAMVNLNDYMSFVRSCNNELFTLRYNFNMKAIFEEDDGEGPHQAMQFQDFVVQSKKKQLLL